MYESQEREKPIVVGVGYILKGKGGYRYTEQSSVVKMVQLYYLWASRYLMQRDVGAFPVMIFVVKGVGPFR